MTKRQKIIHSLMGFILVVLFNHLTFGWLGVVWAFDMMITWIIRPTREPRP